MCEMLYIFEIINKIQINKKYLCKLMFELGNVSITTAVPTLDSFFLHYLI